MDGGWWLMTGKGRIVVWYCTNIQLLLLTDHYPPSINHHLHNERKEVVMKRSIVNISALLFLTGLVEAQLLRSAIADGYMATGFGSGQHTDVFTIAGNPAALAQLHYTSAGIYSEQRFLLKELTGHTLATGLITKHGHLGVIVRHAGFSAYAESQFSLLHARSLGSKTDVGIQFNYTTTRISNVGSLTAIGFEIASAWHLSEKIHAGIHIANPVKSKKWKDLSLPSTYKATWGYEASEKFFAGVVISKEEDQPVNVQVALQYKFHLAMMARLGLSSATSSAWAGAGVSWKNSRLDIIAAFHPQLGITPAMALTFILCREKNEP
jgi:hypothetical protein